MDLIGGFWSSIMDWLQGLFFQQEMELTVLGLQNAGKTTLVNLLSTGEFTEDRIPTVGFNMRKFSKGGVSLKVWDLGGQARFRTMWERYCSGVNAVVYVVDAADEEKFETSKVELHDIMARDALGRIPLLFLGNKNDLPGAVNSVDELIELFELQSIENREVACYSVSGKNRTNIDNVLRWLIAHGKSSSTS